MRIRNHVAVKFVAILLCALCLASAIAGGIGIGVLLEYGLYEKDPDTLLMQRQQQQIQSISHRLGQRYALMELGGCPEELVEEYYGSHPLYSQWDFGQDQNSQAWYATIRDEKGKVVWTEGKLLPGMHEYTANVTVDYVVILDRYGTTKHTEDMEKPMIAHDDLDEMEATVAVEDLAEAFLTKYADHKIFSIYDYEADDWVYYAAEQEMTPELTVTVWCDPEVFAPNYWNILVQVWENRDILVGMLGIGLLLFAATFVYLCCVAGRSAQTAEIRAAGLNRLPLDMYMVAEIIGIGLLLAVAQDGAYRFKTFEKGFLILLLAEIFVGSLLLVGFFFACAAQFKMGGFFWLRNSAIGVSCLYGTKVIRWCWVKFCQFCIRIQRWLPGCLWHLCSKLFGGCKFLLCALWKQIRRFFDKLFRGVERLYSLLPVMWQWLVVGLGLIVVLYFTTRSYSAGAMLLGVGIAVAVIVYGAGCFGILMESARRMSRGEWNTKVSDQFLTGAFKTFAKDLNALADVAVIAAQKQMRSERMKAELVTNVSHDIKTPLTSIINYVDLLQKAESEEERQQYLEVLERQSMRMKKLIEDLMEMSKATTGNMPVDIVMVEATEAINQALGEFSDKLTQAQLTPVFNPPEQPVYMKADGRLAWRVMSNLLSNAVKYALPGTRLYVDLVSLEDKVLISFKNISKEQLNISPEELLERFVRGDASRNTEGSGLGLNIARSLMELQHGQLQLLVDGDLFKVTMVFPGLNEI